jgi:hypothetical protein
MTPTRWIVLSVCGLAIASITACSDDGDTEQEQAAGGQSAGGTGATSGDGGGGGGGLVCPESNSTVADCAAMCQAAAEAACPDAPTQAECQQQCADLNAFVSMCPAWGGVVDCMGDAPTFTCMFGEQVPVGCEEEFYCLSLCFN